MTTSRSEPMKMKYCKCCHETVPMFEYAGNVCLDCVRDTYTSHGHRLRMPLAPKL